MEWGLTSYLQLWSSGLYRLRKGWRSSPLFSGRLFGDEFVQPKPLTEIFKRE